MRSRVRGHHAPSSITADEDKGRVNRQRGGPQLPSDPVRGPGRKPERDDPSHRKPLPRSPRFLRRGNGSIQVAIGRVRRPQPARGGRQRANAPARNSRGWLPKIGGVALSAPTTNTDADGARIFRGKLKTARRRHGQTRHLGDNCAERAMPQPLLETGEQRLLIARHDAVGQETGLGDGGRKEILPGDTPQHPTFCARRNSGGEERSGRTIDRTIAAAGHFMQCAEGQASAAARRWRPQNHCER
jgi:hypothetical protein